MVHAEAPASALKVPIGQLAHLPLCMNLPWAQTTAAHEDDPVLGCVVPLGHLEQEDAPAAEYSFVMHDAQSLEPVAEEKSPATQVTHWVPPVVSL